MDLTWTEILLLCLIHFIPIRITRKGSKTCGWLSSLCAVGDTDNIIKHYWIKFNRK